MILTFVLRYAWHGLSYIPYNKEPWIYVDYTSNRHSRIGSMYNRRRSEAVCYLELILFLTLRSDVVWTLYGHLSYVMCHLHDAVFLTSHLIIHSITYPQHVCPSVSSLQLSSPAPLSTEWLPAQACVPPPTQLRTSTCGRQRSFFVPRIVSMENV